MLDVVKQQIRLGVAVECPYCSRDFVATKKSWTRRMARLSAARASPNLPMSVLNHTFCRASKVSTSPSSQSVRDRKRRLRHGGCCHQIDLQSRLFAERAPSTRLFLHLLKMSATHHRSKGGHAHRTPNGPRPSPNCTSSRAFFLTKSDSEEETASGNPT